MYVEMQSTSICMNPSRQRQSLNSCATATASFHKSSLPTTPRSSHQRNSARTFPSSSKSWISRVSERITKTESPKGTFELSWQSPERWYYMRPFIGRQWQMQHCRRWRSTTPSSLSTMSPIQEQGSAHATSSQKQGENSENWTTYMRFD